MARLPSGHGGKWISTRYGYVLMRLDEDRDIHDLFMFGASATCVGWITEGSLHRAGRTDRDLVEDVVRDYLREKERLASGEHRREDQEGQEVDPGADGPGAEEGDDARPGADEEAGAGPREDLEPAVAGWRGWRVEGLKLRPSAFNGVWHPTDVNRAICHRYAYNPYRPYLAADHFRHEVPAEGCVCGFWAYRTRAYMTKDAPGNLNVFGVVALGGDVVETVHGFRAAEARIVALLDTDAARELESLWNSGAEVRSDRRGNLTISHRDFRADFVGERRGRFPIPILSEIESEMLAIEQGCVFESEPVRVEAPKIGQYLVPSGGGRDRRYANEGFYQDSAPASIVFAPVDKPPAGAFRLDTFLMPADAYGVSVRVAGNMVDLRWTIVRRPNGPDVGMWCVAGYLNDRDFALNEARERYGDGWLKRFEV